MENANAKCKGNLAFQAPKSSPSGNATANYCNFFCNSATVQFYLKNCTIELHCSTILKKKKICLFTYLTLSPRFLCFSSPFSLHNGLSLSHHISLSRGLFQRGSWVRRGGETREVEIDVVWWQFLVFLGPNRCGMIGGIFKLFLAWVLLISVGFCLTACLSFFEIGVGFCLNDFWVS